MVLSLIARNQIKKSSGALEGAGMALAGLICGIAGTALNLGLIVLILIV